MSVIPLIFQIEKGVIKIDAIIQIAKNITTKYTKSLETMKVGIIGV
jgi:hypothetical protein